MGYSSNHPTTSVRTRYALGGNSPLPALDERTLTASRREFGGGLMEKGSQGAWELSLTGREKG